MDSAVRSSGPRRRKGSEGENGVPQLGIGRCHVVVQPARGLQVVGIEAVLNVGGKRAEAIGAGGPGGTLERMRRLPRLVAVAAGERLADLVEHARQIVDEPA